MAVDLTLKILATISESASLDLAAGAIVHMLEFPGTLGTGNYTTGTTDNKQNRVFSDSRSLASTSETLDLYGGLTDAFGVAINFVEVRGIYIKNKSTTAANELRIGNGAAPAYDGLFTASTHIALVPASGVFFWFAPLDGGGLVVTNTTAQDLKIDSPAATVTYDIIIWGVDA